MGEAKTVGKAVVGLFILLVLLMVGLNLLGKVPGVGKVAKDAKNLVTDGTING